MNSHVKYIYLFISSFQVSVFVNGDTKRDLFDVISVNVGYIYNCDCSIFKLWCHNVKNGIQNIFTST